MRDFAKSFYNSKQWKKTAKAYMQSKYYICERCGKPAYICHHKKYIQPWNINDINITLNFNNLECLCIDCHNLEHAPEHKFIYDELGNIISAENKELKQFKAISDTIIKGATNYISNNINKPPKA